MESIIHPHKTNSFFIDGQCLFGAYPTQEQVLQLESWGVNVFVNLVNTFEKKIKPYVTSSSTTCIKFSIPDQQAPDRVREFCSLIIYLSQLVSKQRKIFIHCKAGHGRSSLVVACLLAHHYGLSPQDAIQQTKQFHTNRQEHSKKLARHTYWKQALPMNQHQVRFVLDLFRPVTLSSFVTYNYEWLKEKYQVMLMNTGLGKITGPYGALIQMHRDSLIENTTFF